MSCYADLASCYCTSFCNDKSLVWLLPPALRSANTLTLNMCMDVNVRIHATADHGTSQPGWRAGACDCLQTGQKSWCGTRLRFSGTLRSACMPGALWTAGMAGYKLSAARGGSCWRCCIRGLGVEGPLQGAHSPFRDGGSLCLAVGGNVRPGTCLSHLQTVMKKRQLIRVCQIDDDAGSGTLVMHFCPSRQGRGAFACSQNSLAVKNNRITSVLFLGPMSNNSTS
jgi:hypothetical protein